MGNTISMCGTNAGSRKLYTFEKSKILFEKWINENSNVDVGARDVMNSNIFKKRVWILSKFWPQVMLMTTLCWWLHDRGRFKMLVSDSICWRRFLSPCLLNVKYQSSNLSPTSVVNIDLAKVLNIFWECFVYWTTYSKMTLSSYNHLIHFRLAFSPSQFLQ